MAAWGGGVVCAAESSAGVSRVDMGNGGWDATHFRAQRCVTITKARRMESGLIARHLPTGNRRTESLQGRRR